MPEETTSNAPIEFFAEGQALQAAGQSHIVHALVETAATGQALQEAVIHKGAHCRQVRVQLDNSPGRGWQPGQGISQPSSPMVERARVFLSLVLN